MRLVILGVLAAAAILAAPSAQAREYPWCARYDWSTSNCGFVSFQQCLATISGIGGVCEPNPRYAGPPPRQKTRPAPR